MYGVTTFLGTGFGAIGAILSGMILDRFEYPFDFFLIFLIAAIAILFSWVFLAMTREPVGFTTEDLPMREPVFARMSSILRSDGNFRRFLIVRTICTLGTMGLGFITVSAVEKFSVADQTVGFFTVTMLIGQTIGGLVAGVIADRVGHKRSLALGALTTAFAFAVILVQPTSFAYFPAFALAGFATGVNLVSGLLVALEFAPVHQRRPIYIGITNTVLGVAGLAAPLLGGWIAFTNYELVFGLSIALSIVGLLLLLFWIHDPRYRPVVRKEKS